MHDKLSYRIIQWGHLSFGMSYVCIAFCAPPEVMSLRPDMMSLLGEAAIYVTDALKRVPSYVVCF
jgi:hypothetical protein